MAPPFKFAFGSTAATDRPTDSPRALAQRVADHLRTKGFKVRKDVKPMGHHRDTETHAVSHPELGSGSISGGKGRDTVISGSPGLVDKAHYSISDKFDVDRNETGAVVYKQGRKWSQ